MRRLVPCLLWLSACTTAAVADVATPTTSTTTTSTSTTTTTTTSTTTTTTTTIPAGEWQCPDAVAIAAQVGFPADVLLTVDKIVMRESTCNPTAVNIQDVNGGSWGYAQVNGVWLDWFLPSLGIAYTTDDLLDPVINLRAAHAIWQRHEGFRAWGL